MKKLFYAGLLSFFIAPSFCRAQANTSTNRKNAIKVELLTPVMEVISDDNSRILRINYERFINPKFSYQLGLWFHKYDYESTYTQNFYYMTETTIKSKIRAGTIQSSLKYYPFTKPGKIGGFYVGGNLGIGLHKVELKEQVTGEFNGQPFNRNSEDLYKNIYGTFGGTIGGQFLMLNKRLVLDTSICINAFKSKNIESPSVDDDGTDGLGELINGLFVQAGYAF